MLASGRCSFQHPKTFGQRLGSGRGCWLLQRQQTSRPSTRQSGRVPVEMQITGKTVLITGANRGIGLEFAKQFLAKGNKVIATSRQPQQAKELNKLKDAVVTQLDVSDPASISAWAKGLKGHTSHIDVLINNAGILIYTDFERVTAEEMVKVFQTNTVGPLLVAQQLYLAGLIGRPGTLIGNVTSKVGSVDDNGSGGGYAYRASKSALNIVNKSMSIDLQGDGVTSVLLHPGWVKTDMTGNNGLITAAQSAQGLISVLESNRPLNGRWYDYAGKEIPW